MDAEDLTQECLIKVITRLSSFRGQSKFRTWLYTIVSRHALDLRRQPIEKVFSSLAAHAELLDGLPELPDDRPIPADRRVMVRETRSACLEGMLLCLDRPQRLIFILGGLFRLPSRELGQILGLTPAAARQRLSRARCELRRYMAGQCGLVNRGAPCRCRSKTTAAIRAGYVDLRRRVFTATRLSSVRRQVERIDPELEHLPQGRGLELFLSEPFLRCRPSFLHNLMARVSRQVAT